MSISAFTRYKLTDIPEALRLLAQQIECEEIRTERILIAIELDEGIDYRAFGHEPYTRGHASGLAMGAAMKIMLPIVEGKE